MNAGESKAKQEENGMENTGEELRESNALKRSFFSL